ncbi:MAG: SEC-C domain-containing protein [Betaproteobacteria bacterium]|nr:SEC-C domain-containing protein [Betaproteobacteria bacterium]
MAKIGRNNPCPCGSGQKYRRCHGSDRHTTLIHAVIHFIRSLFQSVRVTRTSLNVEQMT